MLKEFKEFAVKGNVIDLAVAVVVGGAFGKITSSLVEHIIMPPIGLLLGGVDFSNLAITLKEASDGAEAVTLNHGLFINTIIDFVIIAFAIFIVVKQINKFNKKEPAPEPNEKECPHCISNISIKANKCKFCGSSV